jgi:hypothetical protein
MNLDKIRNANKCSVKAFRTNTWGWSIVTETCSEKEENINLSCIVTDCV